MSTFLFTIVPLCCQKTVDGLADVTLKGGNLLSELPSGV